jgi:serine/threonine-protein phosphatase 5
MEVHWRMQKKRQHWIPRSSRAIIVVLQPIWLLEISKVPFFSSDSIKDFKEVLNLEPKSKEARQKLSLCQKELKRLEFEKAICVDDLHVSIEERLGDVNGIPVEDSYDGPHLPDTGITLDFVVQLLEHMKNQKRLHRKYALQILLQVKKLLESRPTIEDVTIPDDAKLTVCGDIHGQYYDLLHVFEINGLPSPTNMYLWNGDFVDRGSFSVECIFALFSFKLLYPDSIFLSRGNHETDGMNRVYGFEGEVKAKYNPIMFELFSKVFNAVPLGNLIMNQILVVHGGLFSRDDVTIQELREINRFQQVCYFDVAWNYWIDV